MKNTLKALLLGAALSTAFIGSASAVEFKPGELIGSLKKGNKTRENKNKAVSNKQAAILQDKFILTALKKDKIGKDDLKKFFIPSQKGPLFHTLSGVVGNSSLFDILKKDKPNYNGKDQNKEKMSGVVYASHLLKELLDTIVGKKFDVAADTVLVEKGKASVALAAIKKENVGKFIDALFKETPPIDTLESVLKSLGQETTLKKFSEALKKKGINKSKDLKYLLFRMNIVGGNYATIKLIKDEYTAQGKNVDKAIASLFGKMLRQKPESAGFKKGIEKDNTVSSFFTIFGGVKKGKTDEDTEKNVRTMLNLLVKNPLKGFKKIYDEANLVMQDSVAEALAEAEAEAKADKKKDLKEEDLKEEDLKEEDLKEEDLKEEDPKKKDSDFDFDF